MRWFFTKLLIWKEPVDYVALRRKLDSPVNWWPAHLGAISLTLGLTTSYLLGIIKYRHHLARPDWHPPTLWQFLTLALILSSLTAYVPTWRQLKNRTIIVFPYFIRIRGQDYANESFNGYSWTSYHGFTCLILHRMKKPKFHIGVPDWQMAQRIEEIFKELGIQKLPDNSKNP